MTGYFQFSSSNISPLSFLTLTLLVRQPYISSSIARNNLNI